MVTHTQFNQNLGFSEFETKRAELLTKLKQKQSFRVAIGKSTWVFYLEFNPAYNLREILDDEIVIEFDCTDKELVYHAITSTAINLQNAGIQFEIWEHGGKSPHIHVRNLPIQTIEKAKLSIFKKVFIRRYVSLEYLPLVDFSLTGVHLVALEWAKHWKGCYGTKILVQEFK